MPLSAQPETRNVHIVASTGATRSVTISIRDYDGRPVTGWDDETDTLSVQVWPGDDREPLDDTGVSASWLSDTSGTVSVVTDGTHVLPPKKYHWRLLVTLASETTYELARGAYTVLPAPGSASNEPDGSTTPYTTFDDLQTVAPWIGQLLSATDRAGLMEHQEAARQWLDQLILDAWVGANTYATHYPAYYGWGGDIPGPAKWLQDVLATGTGVEVTPKVKRACALFACYSVCMAQVTADDKGSAYRTKAAEFRKMAAGEVIGLTVRVKANTTATTYTVPIRLGIGARN